MATHAAVAAIRATSARQCPVLAEAAALIGDRQVRNRGTIGGSLAHADPGADYPTVVTALGATIAATGPDGAREIAAPRVLHRACSRPRSRRASSHSVAVPGTGTDRRAYVKHKHPASGYAVVGVGGGRDRRRRRAAPAAKLVVGGVTGVPVDAAGRRRARSPARPVRRRDRRGRSGGARGARRRRSATATPRPSTARTSRGCSRGGRSPTAFARAGG